MTYDAVDVFGFAGGMTLGMVQAGFHLVGKREGVGGFGVANCEANRHLLGNDWHAEARPPHEWTPIDSPVIFGNPPCSGFSLLSSKKFRGINSPANVCMHEFTDYAVTAAHAFKKSGPQIIAFESVAQAYKLGAPLMRDLREKLEVQTGDRWDLHHVLHNALSIGGPALRKRYFFVATRHGLPFGIEEPEVTRVPSLMDVVGDLAGLASTWGPQPYRRPASWWAEDLRREDGVVDGHMGVENPAIRRARDLMAKVEWNQGESISAVARRYYDKFGHLPESWAHNEEKLVRNDFAMGFNQLHRWRGERVARVVTGGALELSMHPFEDRCFTHREVARIQGFPDTWLIEPLRTVSGLRLTWGKGIPVHCGRWIGGWIKAALDGNPGSQTGNEIGDREYLHDVTNAYRAVSSER